MRGFNEKSITHEQSLAELITAARIRKGITVAEASHALQIQSHYLQAFEDGHFDALPGELYARKYLECYAHFLGLPVRGAMQRLEHAIEEGLWTKTPREIKVHKGHFTVWPRQIRLYAAVGAIVVLGGYFTYALAQRMQPPPLAVAYPPDGLVTHMALLNVSGKTEPEVLLTINGTAVLVDNRGIFFASLNLHDGINYIRVSVSRRMGKERSVEIIVVRE